MPQMTEEGEIIFSEEELREDGVYSESRALEYPPMKEQLDALWKGGDAQEAMRQKIIAIKDKYPKE
jgi:hypothetical protein